MKIDGEFLSNLRFADDIFLCTETPQELQRMLQELSDESRRMGLKMNIAKTKVIVRVGESRDRSATATHETPPLYQYCKTAEPSTNHQCNYYRPTCGLHPHTLESVTAGHLGFS